MKISRIGGKLVATFSSGIIILSVSSTGLAGTKEKQALVQKFPTKETFVACHPFGADMSPEGKRFVNANAQLPTLSVLEFEAEKPQRQIRLPKKAHDVVFINETKVVVSFGRWGEIAVVDIRSAGVDAPFQVGASADGMCRDTGGRVAVINSKENHVHLVEINSKAVLKTFPVHPNAAQMRWAVPDLELEIADAQGKILNTIELPR
jgi:DNA-binding beta-propeller fold protein YncE